MSARPCNPQYITHPGIPKIPRAVEGLNGRLESSFLTDTSAFASAMSVHVHHPKFPTTRSPTLYLVLLLWVTLYSMDSGIMLKSDSNLFPHNHAPEHCIILCYTTTIAVVVTTVKKDSLSHLNTNHCVTKRNLLNLIPVAIDSYN